MSEKIAASRGVPNRRGDQQMVSLMSVPAVLTATLPPAQLGAAFKAEHAKADAIIGYAARVQDWPLLEQAVDEKIAEQKWFVEEWWDKNVGANWGGNRSKNADTAFLNVQRAETATGISQQQVARWRKELRNPDKYREKLILAACRKAGLKSAANHRAEGTGENEWYTPTEYVEAAREVMGAIDLDPATHLIAQQTVRAYSYFTAEDDGLSQAWRGRVWLNPPYAQPLIGEFVDKLVAELADGRVTQAIMLTHNYTDTGWFHQAVSAAAALCFTRGRIKFHDEDGDPCSPTQGQIFSYFGLESDRFRSTFNKFGSVVVANGS